MSVSPFFFFSFFLFFFFGSLPYSPVVSLPQLILQVLKHSID